MHRNVLREMHQFIQQRSGRPWMEAVLDGNVFECTTYGAFAAHLHKGNLLQPAPPRWTLSYWWPKQVERFAEDFLTRIRGGNFKIVLIQSNAGRTVAEFRSLIEQAWAAQPSRSAAVSVA